MLSYIYKPTANCYFCYGTRLYDNKKYNDAYYDVDEQIINFVGIGHLI